MSLHRLTLYLQPPPPATGDNRALFHAVRAAIAKADTREGSPQNRIIVAFSVGKWANRYAHDLEALNARRSNKLSFRDALSLAKARAGMKRGWHRAMEVAGLMETVAHVERAQDLPVWRAAKAVLEGAWWLVDFTNGRYILYYFRK